MRWVGVNHRCDVVQRSLGTVVDGELGICGKTQDVTVSVNDQGVASQRGGSDGDDGNVPVPSHQALVSLLIPARVCTAACTGKLGRNCAPLTRSPSLYTASTSETARTSSSGLAPSMTMSARLPAWIVPT